MHLMVRHILALTVLHQHRHHPFHLPARFIQQIRISVVILGKVHRSVRISSCRSRPYRRLVLVLHHPERDTAIDHIFAMVTRIVPAAAHILRTGGCRIPPCLLNGRIVRCVSGRTRQGRSIPGGDILTLDRDPRTVLVKVIQRIIQQRRVDLAVSDGKIPGRGSVSRFDMIGTGSIQSGKIDHMHAVSRIRIGPQHF